MTPTTQTPGTTLAPEVETRLTVESVIAHGDTMTQAVAEALATLVADVELQLGPTEAQADPSEIAPERGAHGVMISLGGGSVVQVAVILDDALQSRFVAAAPVADDPAAPPEWLGVVSNAIDGWARSTGSVVSGALSIDRAAEIDHLLSVEGDLVLVAAGLFHEGRHAGTVALVARAAADADGPIGGPADDQIVAPVGTAAATAPTAPTAPTAERVASAAKLAAPSVETAETLPTDPPRAAALRALADVEMLVTVELGRTRMNVADLLELGPGAVIELDRTAGSPIDLLVNGTLIARGEVVVIDEEYGIRLTEIVGSGEV